MKNVFLLILLLGFLTINAQTPPNKTNSNLILATYNIKWLGQNSPDLNKLARVIARFDVVGIQEVKKEDTVADLVKELNDLTNGDWGYVFSARTHRPGGSYHEAYAVIYDAERVRLGDGIISNIWDNHETYRNDPFIVSLKRKNFDFTLLLVHTRWSNDEDGYREGEVRGLERQVEYLRDNLLERDIIVMGDFNYSGTERVMEKFADDTELIQIDDNPKTTFKNDYSDYASSYDHIYISKDDTDGREFSGDNCDRFDVTDYIYGSNSETNMELSKSELSDHLPVWAVFRVTLSDDD